MPKLLKIRADELEAGDRIVVKEGSIRKYFHVCEVHISGKSVHYIYNVRNERVHMHCTADHILRVRDD